MVEHQFRHVAEDAVGVIAGEIDGDALAIAGEHLPGGQPAMRLPRAFPDEHGNQEHPFALLPVQQIRNLLLDAEAGGQIIGRDKEHRGDRVGHGVLDGGMPFFPSVDLAILPDDHSHPGLLQGLEVWEELVLPYLVLVAVADEYLGHGWVTSRETCCLPKYWARILDLRAACPATGGENGGYGEAKNGRPRRAENGRPRRAKKGRPRGAAPTWIRR